MCSLQSLHQLTLWRKYRGVSASIINIPRLLGLYGENIGSPGLGSRDRAATSHTVNKIYHRQTIQNQSVVTLHHCHKR